VHAGYVAELPGGDFEKGFDAGAGRRFETRLGLDGSGDALREQFAGCEWHVETPGEKALEYLQVGRGELGDAVIGE